MKKIIHIGWYNKHPLGGVGKTILEQTRALAQAGAEVEIWHLGGTSGDPEKEDLEEAFPLWKLPIEASRFWQLIRLPKTTRKWIESRRDEIEVVHFHSVFTPQNCHLSKLGIPYVITPNGGWSDVVLSGRRALIKRLWILLFERPMWRRAAFIQGVSREEIRQLEKRKHIAPIRYIPNGVAMPEDTLDAPTRDCILYIGRYDINQKGLDVLLEAMRILASEKVSIPKLIMAGLDYRGGRHELQSFIDKHQLNDAVEMLDPVQGEEKEELFRRAIVFVHTSRWEGLPLVLLEAISHGIPCLLTPGTNVASEWASHGAAVEVPFDARAIATSLQEISKRDLTEARTAARQLAAAEFSWHTIASQLLAMYRDAIGSKLSDYQRG